MEDALASVIASAYMNKDDSSPLRAHLWGAGFCAVRSAERGGAGKMDKGPDQVWPSRSAKGRREGDTAIVAVTGRGTSVGLAVSRWLEGADLFVPERYSARLGDRHFVYRFPLSDLLGDIYHRYRRLVLVVALGAAVRLISALIMDKSSDPGVVVVDERGWNVISLLSGHQGGANALARELAAFLGAHAVITTATDLSGLPALDILLEERGWRCENPEKLPALFSAMLEDEEILIYQEEGEDFVQELVSCGMNASSVTPQDQAWADDKKWKILITDSDLLTPPRTHESKTIIVRPRRLVLGLGCRRGATVEEIEEAIMDTLRRHGLSFAGVSLLATVADKKEEAGINLFASRWGLPIRFLSREELGAVKTPSPPSPTALRALSIPGVCEQAAILASGDGELVVPKEKHHGVTVAVAATRTTDDTPRKGELRVVGLGPGDLGHISPAALRALLSADEVVGYDTYIRQVQNILTPARTVAFRMGEEMERVWAAVREAAEGKRVCLVSGGDPGIYGMAGALGEYLIRRDGIPEDLEVEIIPGIPAMCAAASLLGAPLANDFAAISLSDYLTKWEVIEARIRSAAAADMVLVFYNPASSRRKGALARAAEIVMEYRNAKTPVGVVRNAFRPGQKACTVFLKDLKEMELGMEALVVVGSSSTQICRGLMITPRGYNRGGEVVARGNPFPKTNPRRSVSG